MFRLHFRSFYIGYTHFQDQFLCIFAGNPDTLICGNCRESFGELSELLDHKKSYCKLRFTCKCQDVAFAASASKWAGRLFGGKKGVWQLVCWQLIYDC